MTLTRRPYEPGAFTSIRPGRRESKRLADPVTESAYTAVMRRAQGRCEAAGTNGMACRGRLHWHHRKPVEHGGTSDVCNGLALCEAQHTWAHRNPRRALALGWLVDRRDDPLTVAVLVRGGRRVFLRPDGTYREAPDA